MGKNKQRRTYEGIVIHVNCKHPSKYILPTSSFPLTFARQKSKVCKEGQNRVAVANFGRPRSENRVNGAVLLPITAAKKALSRLRFMPGASVWAKQPSHRRASISRR